MLMGFPLNSSTSLSLPLTGSSADSLMFWTRSGSQRNRKQSRFGFRRMLKDRCAVIQKNEHASSPVRAACCGSNTPRGSKKIKSTGTIETRENPAQLAPRGGWTSSDNDRTVLSSVTCVLTIR